MKKYLAIQLVFVFFLVFVGCTNKHTIVITLDTNDGEISEKMVVEKGKPFTLPIPEKFGHTFLGWFRDSENTLFNETTLENDITLYAKWGFSATSGIEYTLVGNEYIITGYTGTDKVLRIPTQYNGKLVTDIRPLAFYKNSNIESVVFEFSSRIRKINHSTFSGLSNLESVYLHKIEYIHEDAFLNTPKLTAIFVVQQCSRYASQSGVLVDKISESIVKYPENKPNKNYTVPKNIKSIGKNAFRNNHHLETIIISNNVEIVSEHAFYNAESLTNVTFFEDSQLNYIGSQAFSYTKLLSFTIPYYTSDIHSSAFSDIETLTSFIADEYCMNYKSIDGVLFNKSGIKLIKYPEGKVDEAYTVNDTVFIIGENAFYNVQHLTNLTISNTVSIIKKYAFAHTSNLTTISFEEGSHLSLIDRKVFKDATKLETIMIPRSVREIESYAFEGAISLHTISFEEGSNLNRIHSYAFEGTTNLKEISIPDNVLVLEKNSLNDTIENIYADDENPYYSSIDGVLYNKDQKTIISYPKGKTETSFTIPNTVTEIQDYTFYGNIYLDSIIIPDSVTLIGELAFSYTSLETITIPYSLIEIENGAFSHIDTLTSILFEPGSQLETIGSGAFAYNTNLTSITIPQYVHAIGEEAFKETSNLKEIHVDEQNTYYSSLDGVLYNKDQTVLIQYPQNKGDLSFVIPITVIKVSEQAFSNNPHIITIEISNSVNEIHELAFYNAQNLTFVRIDLNSNLEIIKSGAFSNTKILEIFIPKSVYTIDGYVFQSASFLQNIEVDSRNTYYTSIDGVLYNKIQTTLIKYPEAKTKSTFTIIDSLTSINYDALSYTPYLETILVNQENSTYCAIDGVLYDKNQYILVKYPDGKKDSTYTLPDSVSMIDTMYNLNAPYLTEIIVNNENRYFSSIDGVLYNKNQDTIIKYPDGKTYTQFSITASIKKIEDFAFNNNQHLKTLVFYERDEALQLNYHSINNPSKINKFIIRVTNPTHIEYISGVFEKLTYNSQNFDIYVLQSVYDDYVSFFPIYSEYITVINLN